MAASKVFNGGRALVSMKGLPIGIFTDVSWGIIYDEQTIYILGNYGPVEIVYTGKQPVGIQASGWRVLDHGPYADLALPKLNGLMRFDDIEFTITDRANPDKRLLSAKGVKPTSVQQQVAIRQATSLNANYIALTDGDETGDNTEAADAAQLP